MKDKILIWEDKGKRQGFLKAVEAVRDKANDLIRLYNEKQPWHRVITFEDFESLYRDPLGCYDRTLLKNIDIRATGDRAPDPKVLADLFKIDRTGFMQALGISEPVADDCSGCKKAAQTIRVQLAKASAEFYQYAEYLYFIAGTFVLNDEAIQEHCETFRIYAESPEQLEIVNHWQRLCEILNSHADKYRLGQTAKDNLCKILKLQQVDGRLVTNDMMLSEIIKYLK